MRIGHTLLVVSAAWAAIAVSPARGQAAASHLLPPTRQEQPPAAPEFEVAAIHVNKDDPSGRSHIFSSSRDGHFTAINVTLKALVEWAFAFPDARVLGGPAWFNTARFNIEAKADSSIDDHLRSLDSSDAGKLEKQRMVRALLADRFGLKVHQESRRMPAYALVVAKNGPKFQPSEINGTTINTSRSEITVRGSDDTIALLADALARPLGRVVVDETGLHGRYDLTLKWTPDDVADKRSSSPANTAPALDSPAPSIFAAIQEQLGLKLVPRKGAVPVLVVDLAEMPSMN